MNWRKMTFVLALAVGLSGSAWAQDRPSSGYRANEPYGAPRGYEGHDYAREIGYNDGVNDGSIDRRYNRGYRPERDSNFKHADHGYDRHYGDKHAYKEAYRDGYLEGYRRGFGR